MNRVTIRVAMTIVVGITALAASASPAVAAQTPTPNGLCGARNMVNENARDQMLAAMMNHTNENGVRGMFRAVAASSC